MVLFAVGIREDDLELEFAPAFFLDLEGGFTDRCEGRGGLDDETFWGEGRGSV